MDAIYKDTKEKMEKAVSNLKQEFSRLRTGRATPALLDGVRVEYYGSLTPLNQVANVSVPDPKLIVIQPWDISYIEPIEKAIAQSGLGMSSAVDKNVIRLNLPMLTEEYRLSLGKILNEKAEQAKQVIRRQREDVWNKIQAAQKAKEISEDDKFRGKDELQKVVDDYQEKIKTLVEKKKNELI